MNNIIISVSDVYVKGLKGIEHFSVHNNHDEAVEVAKKLAENIPDGGVLITTDRRTSAQREAEDAKRAKAKGYDPRLRFSY